MRTGSGGGFTLIGVLLLVSVLGVALAALGQFWSMAAKREKETELLFIGAEYRKALTRYYQAGPGSEKRYPKRLADMLEDPRFPYTVRHLRRLYRDPLGGGTDWGLERDARGDIVGVFSLSQAAPLKKSGFPHALQHFAAATRYSDWVFRIEAAPAAAAPKEPKRNVPD